MWIWWASHNTSSNITRCITRSDRYNSRLGGNVHSEQTFCLEVPYMFVYSSDWTRNPLTVQFEMMVGLLTMNSKG